MELPSMVQRSGDTLIVRSVVSGNQLYMDHNASSAAQDNSASSPLNSSSLCSTSALEEQLERYRVAAQQQQQQYQQQLQLQQQQLQQQQQQLQQQQHTTQQLDAMELKDESLPQCKIKRNYSCSYCTYFTQNPRYHLTHLRDVHGEKIVINKCKLCLYASRHFQKLVRHMKMVHGCTEGIPGQHGQTRKRGMNREARKRKLEQSAVETCGPSTLVGTTGAVVDLSSVEQVKRGLQLQDQQLRRNVLAFNKQQQEEKQRQQQLQQSTAEAIFVAAYERQLQAQREHDIEVVQQQHNTRDTTATSTAGTFQVPTSQHHHQHQQVSNKSLDVVPPSESNSPPSTALTIAPVPYSVDQEPVQNRLLKCSVCDFTTLYRGQLVDHELEEHCKTKFFRCEKCSYVTHIKARFSKHVKYHSMPMIKCVTCDFRTPYKWNLDRHMKNHGGAGPFKCAACDFTADIKQSLTVHEMNHHVPPVGHAAGMSLARRRNKVGGTDLSDDFLSDSAELLDDQFNNNNVDDYEEILAEVEAYGKRKKFEDEEPTDLSQKGGSSDTSSVNNHSIMNGMLTPKSKRPVPNLIPIPKISTSVLNLSKDLAASRSSLTDIASMFFNDKQLSEMLEPLDKSDAAQLSPTTTMTSTSSQHSRSLLNKKPHSGGVAGGSLFDKLKLSALTPGGPCENLICPCGHMAKCLSESIIHRKSCNFTAITTDDDIEEEEQDDVDGRLEIDFDDDDKQSHSALNLSVTGSTRCQHCRHRCKSSGDLLNHLKDCTEAGRCTNDSYDSLSGESSSAGRLDSCGEQQHHPMENRVFIWNKMPTGSVGTTETKPNEDHPGGSSSSDNGGTGPNEHNDDNSYYGVETAPGYGEVTKKMTAEEEAANSCLKKVYKCPHCSFWASTASRFHVHIVGHLNKKPFECSLCSYRSNWRWDITKHIRLKTIRDPSHKNARVLMNDETGRRNYTKYNKYITLMKVTEEDGDPKLMKSGEMTPNQVASLAFLNDYKKNVSNGINALNGIKDDVTLEPITTGNTPSKSSHTGVDDAGEGGGQIPDNFMNLPFIATAMMNAVGMAQQQQEQEQQHVTLITPSVTISAVKRSPPPTSLAARMKPSDDLVTDVKQEGNERKTYYKCRRCDFRHTNRDAVLAHVKIHYEDYPIVTATAMTSEPSSKAALQHSQQHTSPLQVAVNSNLYMNKVFAAMCLSQQQQQNQNSASKNINNTPQTPTGAPQQQQQQHSILSSGLLQQAIQGTSSSSPSSNNAPNSAISGLALALAGKSTLNGSGNATATAAGATTFLEHGEQNAGRNEASSSLSALSTGALQQPHATNSSCLQTFVPHPHQQSLQRLLMSPHGTNQRHSPHGGSTNNNINNNHHNHHNNYNNNNNNTFNNNNLVMGFKSTPASAATVCSSNSSSLSNTSPSPNSSQQSATISTATAIAATATVTTLPTANSTPTTSSYNHKNKNSQKGSVGASSSSLLYTSASSSNSNHNHNSTKCVGAGASGSGIYIGGVVHGSYINNSSTTTTPTTSCNLLLNTATANANANATTSNTNLNSNNMLTNDNERRDPSPYRCGHCHQVSNWKHVIQRHCRLKHAGDILIEALDRSSNAKNDRHAAPLYRPLVNMASNESNAYGNTIKALQTQQQRTSNQSASNQNIINNNPTNKNHNNKHNNNVLISKAAVDQLMHSPIARNTNNATPQDIQAAAAAAYLAAAYKAATANVPVSSANSVQNVTSAEDLLLQQQLQQNEQIEITRLPSNNNSNVATSSLAQLLEHSAPPTSALHSQQNSKCKQQKCPLCPYISESKSQMNYHISLHKPTQYECALCSFVCAKKQHLSSHMRTVHQQQAVAAAAAATAASTPSGNLSNLDFSVALQLAAANQAQQEPTSLSQAPHAVDLSALKYLNAGNSFKQQQKQQQQTQQLSNEFHLFKIVSFCAKCPARFPRKINDAVNSTEFQDHLKSHQLSKTAAYKCDFCDFMAPHETLLQAHRFVHTAKYQEKCNELIRNCKEDPEHPAPKLMQITLNKHTGSQVQSAMIWVVDNELGEQFKQQQQNSSISSSSPSPYDNTNSLLKKQLESGPAPLPSMTRNSPSPKAGDGYSSAAASTSASVATSDLAADAGSESGSMAASPASLEKCMHCPYETTNAHSYKAHLQHHVCVSQLKEAFSCEHCDYTDSEENQIAEHTRLHFNAMEKLKTVAFFTSYDQLELSTERAEVAAKKIKDQEVDDNNSSSSGGGSGGSIKQHNIKQEHNNNNEENVANENTLQEMRDKFVGAASATEKEESNRNEMEMNALPPPPPPAGVTVDPAMKKATKIILYKNDGCLSVKKDLLASQVKGGGPGASSSERNNISDRLRRRISRSSTSHLNGSDDPQAQQQSHKTILVNAKTGQVISRN